MVLPAGSTVPPVPYLVALLAAAALVGWRLFGDHPDVDDRTVLALAPWMAAGAATYACSQLGLVPGVLAPLSTSPVVYLTTAIVCGAVWLAARALRERPLVHLALGGAVAALVPAGAAIASGVGNGTLALAWPLGGAFAAVLVAAALWVGLTRARPSVSVTGWAGALVVLGHVLDGVTTAVGVDVLGFGEQTPLSRIIIEAGAALPTEPYLGGAWLFVVVKAALAVGVVALFTDYVREEPREGFALLGLIAAVGLGPGAHNVVLFAAAGG